MAAEDIFGFSRIDMALEPDKQVVQTDNLKLVTEEILSGRPIQYIIGHADFMDMKLNVREGVLIPRQETEELVEWIVRDTPPAADILDIGTGSGAIAIALAKSIADSRVTGIDISDTAIEVARSNTPDGVGNIRFIQCDILSDNLDAIGSGYDVVVSNPPYIPHSDMASMHINVTDYEPHDALFVPDDDPLLFYRRIAEHSRSILKAGGALYFEIYEHFAAGVTALLGNMGYTDIEVRTDIHGKERMVKALNPTTNG
jgi:release factor glutamine methyltransferase